MKRNMGATDRMIRILVAIAITVLYFTNVITGTAAIILLAIAGIFIITSIFGFCPLYRLAGLNTSSVKKTS